MVKISDISHGELNHTLHKKAKEVLTALGHNVKETVIDAGYDVEAEIEKFLWMDTVIGKCQAGGCTNLGQ